MATTAERLAALEEAWYAGTSSVSIDGKTVSYDRATMRRMIDDLRAELGTQRQATTVTRFRR